MRLLGLTLILACSLTSHAERIQIPTFDRQIKLDGFISNPEPSRPAPHGVLFAIGGSGYTHGGFGGPSRMAKLSAENGFIGIEWNKRGIETDADLKNVSVNDKIYRTATLENLVLDSEAVLEFAKRRYPGLPIFVVGGSEGSMVTSRLAQLHPKEIRALANFGTVAWPFIRILGKQIMDNSVRSAWAQLDLDKDQELSKSEFSAEAFGKQTSDLFNVPFEKMDISGNGRISWAEMERYLVNYFVNENPDPDYWLKTSQVPDLKSLIRMPSLFERAANIVQPYLLLQGEDDELTPVGQVYELEVFAKAMGLRNLEFKYFANTGHAPSETMMREILTFFGKNK